MEKDWEAVFTERQRLEELRQSGELARLYGPPFGYDNGPDCGDCPFADGAPDASPPPCGIGCPGPAARMEQMLTAEQKAVSSVCIGCNQWLACGGGFHIDCEEDEADRVFHAEQADRREEALGR